MKKLVKVDEKWERTKSGNLKYIPKMGSTQQSVTDFARIRSWGDKNSATTHDNLKVERSAYLYAEGYGLVTCAQYELHFIFEDKSNKIGRWAYLCTCGSIAGIVSYKELVGLVSPELGEYILVCIAHTASRQNVGIGSHADGSHE